MPAASNFVGWQTAQAATWQRAFPGRTHSSVLRLECSLLCTLGPRSRYFLPFEPLGYAASSRGRHSDAEC